MAGSTVAQNGVPHIDSNAGDDFVYPSFLRGLLTRGLRRVARPLGGAKGVSEHALRLLVPFARCPKRDAAEAQGYRNGRLVRGVERSIVVALALGLGHGTIAMPVHGEGVLVLCLRSAWPVLLVP